MLLFRYDAFPTVSNIMCNWVHDKLTKYSVNRKPRMTYKYGKFLTLRLKLTKADIFDGEYARVSKILSCLLSQFKVRTLPTKYLAAGELNLYCDVSLSNFTLKPLPADWR